MNKREHTDREYEAELTKVREQILLMGAKVEEMITNSIRALMERDSDLARRMIEFDHQINRLEMETDEACLRILARRQPVASDLRFLTMVLKFVTDLERMGDLGVNICERVIELNADPPLRPYVDVAKMAEEVQAMVREALDAFVSREAERAQHVINRDRTVDAFYAQIFRELLTYMMENPRNIFRATRVQSIAKYLERIGDHATNLAEMVVFMVKGKDIRHTGRLEAPGLKRAPKGVLFMCPRNAALSQMAEGWARQLLPASIKAWSAGTRPAKTVDPIAVRVMQERGVDISNQRTKPMGEIPLRDVDTVIILGSEEYVLPDRDLQHERWVLADPAQTTGSQQDVEEAYRQTCAELRSRVEHLSGM